MPKTISKAENHWTWLWSILIVGLTCVPYLLAWQVAPADTQYTGLLINHYDGESYYAKMQQGARGEWLFHLAFTPEPHAGAFIYTFYLALGHLAAALNLPIPLVYHMGRVTAGLFLLLVAYRFIARVFDRIESRRTAFLLLGLSAGLGWFLSLFGIITSDLWVAEGFTFLSILVNPHFPLGMGLMLLIFVAIIDLHTEGAQTTWRLVGATAASLTLSLVHPVSVPIALAVLLTYLFFLAWRERKISWREVAGTGLVGAAALPVLINGLLAFSTNPALAAWFAQNLTPSLPPWNYALGYGLILALALGGIVVALRRRERIDLFLLAWVCSVAVLLYLPFALQRRFITGLHVPLTLLAALALEQLIWQRLPARRRSLVTGLIVGFCALTSLFVPLITVLGVARDPGPLVMSREEAAACEWLQQHTNWTDTVLTPPESGQFFPAWAGNRVVYGHPFETINAEAKEIEAARFYSSEATTAERQSLLQRYGVRYVFAPDDVELNPTALGLVPTWSGGTAVLYGVEETP